MSRKTRTLLLTLLLSLSLLTAAGAAVYKDEVVYAALKADGSVKDLYVVNAFEADEPAKVTDYGAYSKAFPLSLKEDFAFENGQADFNMEKGRFAYQGDLSGKELPWQFQISYTLNGKAVDAPALSGVTGKIEGRIRVSVNPAYRGIAESLSLQISVTLDGDRSRNIIADKATIAHAAGNLVLSYVILPGLEADYLFSLDAADFAMPAIQIAGVRMGMDAQMYQDAAKKAMAGSPLEGTVGNLMGGFLDAMQGQKASSFTESRNEVRALQFVMMTEEIPPKTEPRPAMEQADDGSFIERLGKLLGL